MGAFANLSRNVPFCPRLSFFVLLGAQNGDKSGQKRTKTGHFGTNWKTPPFISIYPHLALLKRGGVNAGESLGGSQAPPSFWEVPGLPRKFPGSFSVTSPEVLSLWNLAAIHRFPGSFPNFPGGSRTSPEVSPFLWEA